ncbi:MAG: Flp pilus assembly protein CpaB, partial [Desulfuromonas sp.]
MKKYGTLIALAVAIIFGIAAVFLANQWMSTQVTEQKVVIKEQAPMAKVVIAGQDLDMGTQLSDKNLSLVDWPKANIPKGAFTSLDSIVGRVASTKVIAGTPLVDRQLAAPGSGVGLVASIRPGKRAMTIRVDEVVGVGGFILPNTFVDILSVQGKGKTADTVFKRIEVLAIAQETF